MSSILGRPLITLFQAPQKVEGTVERLEVCKKEPRYVSTGGSGDYTRLCYSTNFYLGSVKIYLADTYEPPFVADGDFVRVAGWYRADNQKKFDCRGFNNLTLDKRPQSLLWIRDVLVIVVIWSTVTVLFLRTLWFAFFVMVVVGAVVSPLLVLGVIQCIQMNKLLRTDTVG